jgi:hypothetical protein
MSGKYSGTGEIMKMKQHRLEQCGVYAQIGEML